MEDKQYETGVLLKRFLPYYKKHWRVIVTDLFCAGLTTICDLVLPMIIRYITNTGKPDGRCGWKACTFISGAACD